jgi:signal transduction histidine kinase
MHPTKKYSSLSTATTFHGVHWLVLGASLLLTIIAWNITDQQSQQKSTLQYQYQAGHLIELVKERLDLYEGTLSSGVAALHLIPNELSAKKWAEYSTILSIESKYPGINGIGFIYYVKPSQLDEYLKAQRIERPSFTIHPTHNKDEYWPITYLEPAESNRKAIGLDIAHETNRLIGAKKARDTGSSQITGPITLVQDSEKTPGFLFYVPHYTNTLAPNNLAQRQEAFVGNVYAAFIVKNLMDGALQNTNRLVNFAIKDGEHLLYNELTADSENFDREPLFSETFETELYGRVWTFDIRSSLIFRSQSKNNQPAFILAAGLFIEVMLIILFIVLTNGNRKAANYADTVTEDLVKNKHELEARNTELLRSNTELDQFAYVASHDLKAPLNAINKLTGWIEEDCEESLPDSAKSHLALLKNRTARMTKLLDDLLLFSRVGRINYEFESILIRHMVNDITMLQGIPDSFVCTAPDITLIAPKVPLEQILRNLIGNAVKHHPSKVGKINISIDKNLAGFHLKVSDDGAGIPKHLQVKAMEMFQTLKPRDEVEGSGLGLALCKKIAECYRGSLHIESIEGQGTTIVVYLPISQQLKTDNQGRL